MDLSTPAEAAAIAAQRRPAPPPGAAQLAATDDRPSWKRSLVKTLTWRAVATVDTFAITYFVTGSFKFAGSIVSIEVVTKLFSYYLHERLWAYVRRIR